MAIRTRRFTLWGVPAALREKLSAGSVRVDPEDPTRIATQAVASRIERDSGLQVVTMSHDGEDPASGARHYQVTLGRRARGGGYSVEGRCWVAIYPPGDPCSRDGCDRPEYARGLCRAHYDRDRRGSESTAPVRNPDAPARVVLSLRVSEQAKTRASQDPEGARKVIERWAAK